MIKNVINYEYGKLRLFKLDFTTISDISKYGKTIEEITKTNKKLKAFITHDTRQNDVILPKFITRTKKLKEADILIGKKNHIKYGDEYIYCSLYDSQRDSTKEKLHKLGLNNGDIFYCSEHTLTKIDISYCHIEYIIDNEISKGLNKIYFIDRNNVNFYKVGNTDITFDECFYLKKTLLDTRGEYYCLKEGNTEDIEFFNALISSLNVRKNIEKLIFLFEITKGRLPKNHIITCARNYINDLVYKKFKEFDISGYYSTNYIYDKTVIDNLERIGIIKPENKQLFIDNLNLH